MKKIIYAFLIVLVALMPSATVTADSTSNNISVRSGGAWYKYRTIKGKPIYKTIYGYVEGIPKGGVSFSHGGQIHINTNSGPKFNISVSGAYKMFSFSVGFGVVAKTSVTHSVTIPKGGFYRVWAEKKYRIDVYRTEKSLYGRGKWKLDNERFEEELESVMYKAYPVFNKTHPDEW